MSASDRERMKSVLTPRWISYPHATDILRRMEDLFDYPEHHRPTNLVVVGEANNGKTLLGHRFVKRHPRNHDVMEARTTVPVLMVNAPLVPDEGRLYNELLDGFNSSYSLKDEPEKKRRQLKRQLREAQTRVIVIDEIHNIIVGFTRRQQAMLVVLKQLGADLGIHIVALGTMAAYRAVQSDEQIGTRFEGIELPTWRYDDSFRVMLQQYETTLPLKLPSNLQEDKLARLIHGRSEGLIGEVAKLLASASRRVIGTADERITYDVVANDPGYVPPSVRRLRAPVALVNVGNVTVKATTTKSTKPSKTSVSKTKKKSDATDPVAQPPTPADHDGSVTV